MLLEICVDSILSATNASSLGADRIELCSALSEGGLTPSLGLFLGVKKAVSSLFLKQAEKYFKFSFQLQNSRTNIYCMIRIRRGNFVYSDEEVRAYHKLLLFSILNFV